MDTLCMINKGPSAAALRKSAPGGSLSKNGNQLSRGPPRYTRHGHCKSQRESLDPLAATTTTLKVPERIDIDNGDCKEQKYVSDAEIDPITLFPEKHFPELSLPLVLYFPIGCILGCFRCILWIILLAIDLPILSNNDLMIKILQQVLGAQVTWHNLDLLPKAAYVMVSNHQTTGDLLSLYSLPHRVIHLVSSGIPAAATKVKNHRLFLQHAAPHVYTELASSTRRYPVHLFPEGGMTNGSGMMNFSSAFLKFAKESPVVPVALRVSHPFNVNVHTLNSSFLANMFFFSFLPWVRLEATILDPLERRQHEKSSDFVKRIQLKISESLQCPIVDFSIKKKRALMNSHESSELNDRVD